MKRRKSTLNAFISETIAEQNAQDDELLIEFLDSALKTASMNLKNKAKEDSKQKIAPTQKATEKDAQQGLGKMFNKLGTVSDTKGKDDGKEEKKIKSVVDNTERFTLLQKSDKDFKNVTIFSKKVTDDLNRWIAKIPADNQILIKKGIVQTDKLLKIDMGKRYQKLTDMFVDAGDEQDLLVRTVLMGAISKVLVDLEKQ